MATASKPRNFQYAVALYIKGKRVAIAIGFVELDHEARLVKLEEAKKYGKALIKANPEWTSQQVIKNLEENGHRCLATASNSRTSYNVTTRIQGKRVAIAIGFAELDHEAKLVKLEEAKNYCNALIKAHPNWTSQQVSKNLEENGHRCLKHILKSTSQNKEEIIALVKDLGHSNFQIDGNRNTNTQHRFLSNLANPTPPLSVKLKLVYNELIANNVDVDFYNMNDRAERLYGTVKDDSKFDVSHRDFYKAEDNDEDDTEVPLAIFEFANVTNSNDDSNDGIEKSTSSNDESDYNTEDETKDEIDDEIGDETVTVATQKRRKHTIFDLENAIFGTRGNPFRRIVDASFIKHLKKQQDIVLTLRIKYRERYNKDPTDPFFEHTTIRFKETANTRVSVLRAEFDEVSGQFATKDFLRFLYKKSKLVEFPLQANDSRSFHRLSRATNSQLRVQHPDERALLRLRDATSRFRNKGGQTNERSLTAVGYYNMNDNDKSAFTRLMNHAIGDCHSLTKKDIEFDHGFAVSRYAMLKSFAEKHQANSIIATNDNSALLAVFQVNKNMFFLPWSMNAVKSDKFIFNIVIIFDPDDINNVIFKFRCSDGVYRTVCELIEKYSDDQLLSLDSKDPVVTQYWGCNIATTCLLSKDEEAAEATHHLITTELWHYTNYGDFVKKERSVDIRNNLDKLKRHIAFEKEMLEQENFTINSAGDIGDD